MKKMILAFSFGVLSASALPVIAQEKNSIAQKNLQATRQYYAQLVNPASPQLAELTMLMTMMPKGGDIHHHYSGAIYAETYLDWVAQKGYCIYRDSDANLKQEKFKVETRTAQITEASKSCLKVEAIRKDNALYRELMSAWSVVDFDNHGHTQLPPDQHFFNTFGYFSSIAKYSTNVGLQILKQQAKNENIQYLETMLRSAPVTEHAELSARLDALSSTSSAADMQQAFSQFADFLAQDNATQKKITDFVKEAETDAAGIDDAEFSLRFQTYVSRNSPASKVFAGLYSAFAASQSNSLIVGVNIVGAEHALIALRDYQLHMHMFAFLKQRFPKVRLSLHAGELALGIVAPEHLQSHIRDAVQIAGAERIGHGVDIVHEARPDQLLAELKKRNVAVEINLSSNSFILGIPAPAHPVTMYMRHQVPIVIGSDDPGVSRNNISHEYMLFASRYKPSYDSLKKTVYNSIRYSFLNTQDKTQQIKLLDQRFLQFEAAAAALAQAVKKGY
ncbi:adenosine deaminase [Undibacterium sp. Ji22W]|uniref:adenosine deaminase n=1 Tax=Undibacterium sp. Ji22W TaxID=3413038 RepID=UPI003BF0B88D